jgi:predicted nucleic acid-binding Zn ribbon protein
MYCPSCSKEIPQDSTFCPHCGKSVQAPGGKKRELSKAGWVVIGIIVTLAAVFAIRPLLDTRKESPTQPPVAEKVQPPPPVLIPVTRTLTSGQLVVRAGTYMQTKFNVDTEKMQYVRVVGSFRASGGSGNDIQVVLADESEFENWINGHQARVLYSTGQITNGKVDVQITESGAYVLAFSNTFSTMTDKDVFAEVELRYKTLR